MCGSIRTSRAGSIGPTLETTDAGADSKYRRIGAGYREALGNVDRDAGKPQLSRLPAEVKAAEDKARHQIEGHAKGK